MHADDTSAGRPGTPVTPHRAGSSAPGSPAPAGPPTAPTLSPPTASGVGGGNIPSSPPPAPAWMPPSGWTPPAAPTAQHPTATGTGSPPAPPTGPGASSGSSGGAAQPPKGSVDPRTRQPSRSAGGIKAGIVGGLVGAIVAGGITAAAMTARDDGAAVVATPTAAAPSRNSNAVSGEALDIRALLEKVQPSVVSIHTGTRQGEAAGSGIVLSEDGLVLTNAHVIEGAQRIEVDFADGQTVEARLVGSVPDADVALVKAEGLSDPVVPAELGSSSDLLVGDDVVAIGNALNLGAEPSVTTGIVSQTGRSIQAPDGTSLDDLIQTDAAINPGNSGGPLVNAQGQVVGINTAILADAQNIGFALEIDSIKSLIEDLKAGKDAQKEGPVLGVATLDASQLQPEVADRFSVTATSGAFVQQVTQGSGAEVAGFQVGDVIVQVDGRRIRTSEDVGQAVRSKSPGDQLDIVIERDGQEQSLTATLGSN